MKLSEDDFSLDWPTTIEVKNLRKYIISNLMGKGEVIRWSINNVQKSTKNSNIKKIIIHAVLAN